MKPSRWFALACIGLASGTFTACVGDDPVPASTTPRDSGVPATPEGGGGGPNDSGAAPDAALPSDAGADSACARDHATADFCDDFDNGGYQPAWTPTVTGTGVSVSLVSAPHFSGPFALAARNLGTAPDGGAGAWLETTKSAAGATEFTLDARVQMPAAAPSVPNSSPLALQLKVGPSALVLLQIRTDTAAAACMTTGAQLGGFGADVPFSYGAWHHVILKAVVAGGGAINLSCDVDGVTRTGTKNDVVDANTTLSFGLIVRADQQPMAVLFDDVFYDAK